MPWQNVNGSLQWRDSWMSSMGQPQQQVPPGFIQQAPVTQPIQAPMPSLPQMPAGPGMKIGGKGQSATAANASTIQAPAGPDGWHFDKDKWAWGQPAAGQPGQPGAGGPAGGGAGADPAAVADPELAWVQADVARRAERNASPLIFYNGGDGSFGGANGGTGASGAADGTAAGDAAAAAAAGTGEGFARGGYVHPPQGLRSMARHVARQGRGPDSSLVHITPAEIRGLASLAPGGKLPTNPRTGYPEAGILSSVLGVLGGVGGSFIGMPWLGAGLGSLGGGLLEGKDFGSALTGGILSGLGGYGLGQAASMLGEAGGSAAGDTVAQMAKNGVEAAPLAESAASASSPYGFADSAGAFGGGVNASIPQAAQAASMTNPMSMAQWSDKASNVMKGATDPEALWKTFGTNASKTTLPIGLSLYGQSLMDGQKSGYSAPPPQQGMQPVLPGPNKRKYIPAPPNWDYSTGREWDYFTPAFAAGGSVSGPGSGLDDAIPAVINGRQPAKLSSGEYVVPAHAVSALGNGSTEDGVRHLNGMVDDLMMQKYGTTSRKPRPVNPKKVIPRGLKGPRPFDQGGAVMFDDSAPLSDNVWDRRNTKLTNGSLLWDQMRDDWRDMWTPSPPKKPHPLMLPDNMEYRMVRDRREKINQGLMKDDDAYFKDDDMFRPRWEVDLPEELE